MEIRIYIADLAAYNDGELKGEWVTLPMDEEELTEIVHKYSGNGQHDYAIHDFEAPFKISEVDSPWKLNKLAEELESVNEKDDVIEAIMENWVNPEDAIQVLTSGDYRVYRNCNTMEDVAYEYIEETGLLRYVPDEIKRFFDYAAYGKEMADESTFLEGDGFYVEIYN